MRRATRLLGERLEAWEPCIRSVAEGREALLRVKAMVEYCGLGERAAIRGGEQRAAALSVLATRLTAVCFYSRGWFWIQAQRYMTAADVMLILGVPHYHCFFRTLMDWEEEEVAFRAASNGIHVPTFSEVVRRGLALAGLDGIAALGPNPLVVADFCGGAALHNIVLDVPELGHLCVVHVVLWRELLPTSVALAA